MLEIKNLCVSYADKKVLNHLNFKIEKNSLTAVIGPSGTGKTTLISAICQQVKYEGQILWNKRPLTLNKETIALVPQDFGLLPWLTTEKNISLGIKIRMGKKISTETNQKIEKICHDLKIDNLLSQYPSQLSGGQKQRVALARAFSMSPDLLLLDEPFSALDMVVKSDAETLMLKELKEYPTTTLFVTHDLSEALLLSDQLLFLSKEKTELRDNPLKELSFKERQDSQQFLKILGQLQKEIKNQWQKG